MYLSSDSCSDIFPENSANDFRVKLPKKLCLKGYESTWSLALIDIDLPKFADGYKPDFITLESRVCVSAVYKSGLRPVLQRLYFSQFRKSLPLVIDSPRYVQVNTKTLDVIDVYLLDDKGAKVSFKPGPLVCTLHLIRSEKNF